MRATPLEINRILYDLRASIDAGKFQPEERWKNMNTLASLGISWREAKEEIYNLTPKEYYGGPDIDRNYPTDDKFWKFKKVIMGEIIYIKFKIRYQDDKTVLLTSFHFDEVP